MGIAIALINGLYMSFATWIRAEINDDFSLCLALIVMNLLTLIFYGLTYLDRMLDKLVLVVPILIL